MESSRTVDKLRDGLNYAFYIMRRGACHRSPSDRLSDERRKCLVIHVAASLHRERSTSDKKRPFVERRACRCWVINRRLPSRGWPVEFVQF